MRSTFIKTLTGLAIKDKRIILLSGDLGFMVMESFIEKVPNQFINCGVAEQNMMGIATGLAESGFLPFVYSIVTFASLRPYEFIRNGPILHHLPVKIIAVGGGAEYGAAGFTHLGLEDIGVMRVQPDMRIVAPADYLQAKNALLKTWDYDGPVYYRLGKNDKDQVPNLGGKFQPSKVQIVKSGKNLLVLTMGSIALDVMDAAKTADPDNKSLAVGIVSNFNPEPRRDLAKILRQYNRVITIENHYLVGGLGSLIADVIAEEKIPCQLIKKGFHSVIGNTTGSTQFQHQQHGLSVAQIKKLLLQLDRN